MDAGHQIRRIPITAGRSTTDLQSRTHPNNARGDARMEKSGIRLWQVPHQGSPSPPTPQQTPQHPSETCEHTDNAAWRGETGCFPWNFDADHGAEVQGNPAPRRAESGVSVAELMVQRRTAPEWAGQGQSPRASSRSMPPRGTASGHTDLTLCQNQTARRRRAPCRRPYSAQGPRNPTTDVGSATGERLDRSHRAPRGSEWSVGIGPPRDRPLRWHEAPGGNRAYR